MRNNQLNRILKLIKRTGDKFVVLDKATDAAQVLMSLDSYEDLLGPEFEDDFDPRDIPPFDDGEDNFTIENYDDDDDDDELESWTDGEEMPRRSYSDTSLEWGENDFDRNDHRTIQEIQEEETMKAADLSAVAPWGGAKEDERQEVVYPTEPEGESLADVPHEEEEEKFYLEPVE